VPVINPLENPVAFLDVKARAKRELSAQPSGSYDLAEPVLLRAPELRSRKLSCTPERLIHEANLYSLRTQPPSLLIRFMKA